MDVNELARLRDHYAGLAMAAMISRCAYSPDDGYSSMAKHAFDMADAMIEQRAEREGDEDWLPISSPSGENSAVDEALGCLKPAAVNITGPRGQPVEPLPEGEELWGGDKNCQHLVYCAPGGGIKCVHCPGWFCY